jgi:hypothetical protein
MTAGTVGVGRAPSGRAVAIARATLVAFAVAIGGSPALASTPEAMEASRPDTTGAAPTSSRSFESAPSPTVRAWQTGLLRPDRLQHASLSFTIAAGAGLVGRPRGQAFALTLALGLLKELRDARVDRFDVVDLAADAGGAALGASVGSRR